jgi:hypothetical protein
MATRVFISYRRDDSAAHAGRVHDRLEREFGREALFMDVDTVCLGVDFVEAIREAVAKCDVLLAIVGPNWLNARDEEGNRRLDDENDYVRIEVAAALQRNIPVIPILLDGARMPKADQLPKDLEGLARRDALDVRRASFHNDIGKLIRELKGLSDEAGPRAASQPRPGPQADVDLYFEEFEEEESTSDEVYLGASTPHTVSAGETFVARFAAYTAASRRKVTALIEQEAPTSLLRIDLDHCRWRRGTEVTVQLESSHATVSNRVQTFVWNGSFKVLRFDVTVLDKVSTNALILRFNVAVQGLPIISLRPEVKMKKGEFSGATALSSFTEVHAPKSAFASYVTSDRRQVLSRIRSLQIFTGIDVFLDCLSIRPGEQWKPKLRDEIENRDIFWLFWSRAAMKSPWVDWEWRTALATKSITGIQPHPLEPSDLAPPPKELSALQFGTLYEWYIVHLRQSWLRNFWRRAAAWFSKTGR